MNSAIRNTFMLWTVLFSSWQDSLEFSEIVGNTETLLLYLEEHFPSSHEHPSLCHRHRCSPQTNIGMKRRTFQSFYLCSHVMSPNPNPGIDQHPISTGFISLCHFLEIVNMLWIGLPTNRADLQIGDICFNKGLTNKVTQTWFVFLVWKSPKYWSNTFSTGAPG